MISYDQFQPIFISPCLTRTQELGNLSYKLSSNLMQLLFSFHQNMRVEKTLIQTLACQLSTSPMQLLFSFDQDMRVEKTLIQTLARYLSSTQSCASVVLV